MIAKHIQVLNIKNRFWKHGYYGTGIKILVIDSGISYHRQQGEIIHFPSSVEGDNPEDERGHGTPVAGVINSSNKFSINCGIAPNATVYSIDAQTVRLDGKVYNEQVEPYVKRALEIAITEFDKGNKFHILNCSFNVINSNPECIELFKELVNRGVVPIISTNNFGKPEAQAYANLNKQDLCIAVGATDYKGVVTSWSNKGADFYLPGDSIQTLQHNNIYGIIYASGTSFSAPICSGLAALLIEKRLSKGHDIFKWDRNNVPIVRKYCTNYLRFNNFLITG